MSATEAETQAVVAPKKKEKKLKPARKQVKPGEVEKKEAPQTGKEYSTYYFFTVTTGIRMLTLPKISGITNGPAETARTVTPSAYLRECSAYTRLTFFLTQQNKVPDTL